MNQRLWRQLDPWLYGLPLLLVAFGIAMLSSASRVLPAAPASLWDYPPLRQGLFALLGFGLMLLATAVDYRFLGSLSVVIYLALVALLGLVLLAGEAAYGARRWLDLLILPLQPSEFGKLLIVVVLAKFLADHQDRVRRFSVIAGSLALVLAPMVLIYLQPNLGTTLIFAGIWLGMTTMAGARLSHLASVATACFAAIPISYFVLFRDYMRQRLAAFIDPSADPLGIGYNILQAEISVGSGGLLGKGFAQGTQSQLHFLRIQRTDFIFSVIGEEWGFVGAVLLLSLYLFLLWRSVRAATLARDPFGRYLALGIVLMIFLQVFIHVGGNTRLLPVTGLPLPLISLGGSSLITILISVGILQSILLRGKRLAP